MKQLEGADARGADEPVVTPLRKRCLSGELYDRDPKVEAFIAELAVLPRDELIAMAAITKRSDPRYVPGDASFISFARAGTTKRRQ